MVAIFLGFFFFWCGTTVLIHIVSEPAYNVLFSSCRNALATSTDSRTAKGLKNSKIIFPQRHLNLIASLRKQRSLGTNLMDLLLSLRAWEPGREELSCSALVKKSSQRLL